MSEPATPSYRLKVPCSDEREFREKFQQRFVSRGIFVPSEKARAVGTRVKLKLEIRDGTILVSGDGMVTSVTTPGGPGKPGMTVRLTTLHEGSIEFDLSPTTRASRPRPPPVAARPTPSASTAPGDVGTSSTAVAPTPPLSAPYDDLPDLAEDAADEGPLRPGGPTDDAGAAATDPEPEDEIAIDVAEPEAIGAAPPASTARPPLLAALRRLAARRRVAVLAAAGVLVAATVSIVAVQASRGARARARTGLLDEHLRLADVRLREGRLAGAGGDSALDHLLEAKGAAPFDERVATRLQVLADRFEELGNRALAGKRLREAAVHFTDALIADPTRAKARSRLDAIESKLTQAAPSAEPTARRARVRK